MNVQSIQSQEATAATSAAATGTQNTTDFAAYLGASKSLDEIFSQASAAYNVPKDLLMAIGKAESNFKADATSKSGAQGIMQLMPSTSRYLGVSDPYDPYQNIMGGAKLMRELLDQFNGDTTLALASYNAGSNNVIKYGGVPPFEQTQNYVVKVTGYLQSGISAPTTPVAVSTQTTPAPVAASAQTAPAASSTTSPNVSSVPPQIQEETATDSLLDELFSYDDYLKFIELYTKIQTAENEKKEQEEKEKQEQEQSNAYFSYQGIHYTPAILNLISGN